MTETSEEIMRSKIVIPNNTGDRQKSKELLENLRDISPEYIQKVGEEIERKIEEKKNPAPDGNLQEELEQHDSGYETSTELDEKFDVIGNVDGSDVEYDGKSIVKWKGERFECDSLEVCYRFADKMIKTCLDNDTDRAEMLRIFGILGI